MHNGPFKGIKKVEKMIFRKCVCLVGKLFTHLVGAFCTLLEPPRCLIRQKSDLKLFIIYPKASPLPPAPSCPKAAVIDSLFHWFIYSCIHQFVVSGFRWFIDSLMHRFVDSLIHQFIVSAIYWFIDSSIHWFIDSLSRWFIDSLFHWCMGSLTHLTGRWSCFLILGGLWEVILVTLGSILQGWTALRSQIGMSGGYLGVVWSHWGPRWWFGGILMLILEHFRVWLAWLLKSFGGSGVALGMLWWLLLAM